MSSLLPSSFVIFSPQCVPTLSAMCCFQRMFGSGFMHSADGNVEQPIWEIPHTKSFEKYTKNRNKAFEIYG